MTEPKDLLGIRIPKQIQASSNVFDMQPKKVDAWIEALPLANPGETAQHVLAALSEINRTEMLPAARFKLAEQLRESVTYTTLNLKNNYIGHQLPYSSKCHKYVKQTFALLDEAACTYKILAVQLLDGTHRYDKKLAAYSIYRAIDLNCKLLLTSYQIYSEYPPAIWHELHRLFYLAELKGLLDRPIKDPENKLSKLNSIDKSYKHAMLLSLSSPYRLRKGEIEKVNTALDKWSQYAVIFHADSKPDTNALFVCNLDSEVPPEFLTPDTKLNSSHSRILDVSRLTNILHKEIENQEDKTASEEAEGISHNLIKRLLQNWEYRQTRNFSRTGANSKLEVSVGLNATHYQLDETDTIPIKQDDTTPDNNNQADELSIEPIADNAIMWGESVTSRIHASDYIDINTTGSSFKQPTYSTEKWKTINVSAGGYCLVWDNENPSPAQVGELIGIRDTNQNGYQPWNVGVVRWMQYSENKGLKLGIQILAPNAHPIMTRTISKLLSARARPHNSLILEGLQSLEQPATLLTPTIHYSVGDTLIMDDHGATAIVQLTNQLEITGDFARYEYKPVTSDNEHDLQREIKRHAMELNTLKGQ